MLRLVISLFLTSACCYLQAQQPFIQYIGQSGHRHTLVDMIREANGNLHLVGSIQQAGVRKDLLAIYTVDSIGTLLDSLTVTMDGATNPFSWVPVQDGSSVICLSQREEGAYLQTILLQQYDANGNIDQELRWSDSVDLTPLATRTDSLGNYYLLYNKFANSNPVIETEAYLLKLDASLRVVYDHQVSSALFRARDILPLPNGDVLYWEEYFGEGALKLFDSNGHERWTKNVEQDWRYQEGVGAIVSKGNDYFFVSRSATPADYYELVAFDITTGELGNAFIPLFDLAPPTARFQPFFRGDDLWIDSRNGLAVLSLRNDAYRLHRQYEEGTFGESGLQQVIFHQNDWLILNKSGTLSSFNTSTATLRELRQFTIEQTCADESLTSIHRYADTWRVCINGQYGAAENTAIAALDNDGSILGQPIRDLYDPSAPERSKMATTLANGKSILVNQQNGSSPNSTALHLALYSPDGELQTEMELFEDDLRTRNPRAIVQRPNGELQIMLRLGRDSVQLLTFDNDLSNVLSTYSYPTTDHTSSTLEYHQLQQGHFLEINAMLRTINTRRTVRRLAPDGTISWERSVALPNDNFRLTPNTNGHFSVDQSPSGQHLLIGTPYPSFFEGILLDSGTGDSLARFQSPVPFASAVVVFRSDGNIQLAGVRPNPEAIDVNDRFLLHLSTFDLDGSELTTIIHPIPYVLQLNQLHLIGNDLFAALGRKYEGSDEDGCIILFNAEGDIMTNANSAIPSDNSFTVSPNPSSEHIQLRYTNDYQGVVQLQLYDLQGRLLQNKTSYKTTHNWQWQSDWPSTLPSGQYIFKLQAGEDMQVVSLVVLAH